MQPRALTLSPKPAAHRVEIRRRLLQVMDAGDAGCVARLGAEVRQVVVIASSSRGGSSVFAELLRRSRRLLHFRAELNPFFWLAGLSFPDSGTDSDRLTAVELTPARREHLERLLACDCGEPEPDFASPEVRERYVGDLQRRLSLQWPELVFDRSDVRRWAAATLAVMTERDAWPEGSFGDPQRYFAQLLGQAHARHPQINPYYYDIAPSRIQECVPAAPEPEGPPSSFVVEEPPFVTPVPWRMATAEALATRPLIVKTPSNVHRLEALRALFPAAELRVIHLTRNAAAAINGLYDGWLHRGFFSHPLPVPLAIAGYSDRFPAWGRRWWKFDLPPGWRELVRAPLTDVCAFQWRAAHQAVFDFLGGHPEVDSLRLRFEDLIGPRAVRHRTFEELCGWLGVPMDDDLRRVVEEGLPPIMATEQPRHRRWFERAELLTPTLATPAIRGMMEQLGYERDPSTWT